MSDADGWANNEGGSPSPDPWGDSSEPGGWGLGNAHAVGTAVEGDAGEEVAAPTGWESEVEITGWQAGALGRLPIELVCSIIMFLAPNIEDVAAYANRPFEASVILSAVAVVLQLSRAWYIVARQTRNLWGALLPFLRPGTRTWDLFVLRAGNRALRLFYGTSMWSWPTLDQGILAASAIYAGQWTSWRNWSHFFQSRLHLAHLQVAHLLPDHYHAPIGELPMPEGILQAPLLWLCEISMPLLIHAPNLVRLVISCCTQDQLIAILAPLDSLQELEIQRPRDPVAVDWHRLFTSRNWHLLRSLKIRCRRFDSARISASATAIAMPELLEVDLAAALPLDAARVASARLLHATHDEVVGMLHRMPNLRSLEIPSMSSPSNEVVGPYIACAPVVLSLLEEAQITCDVQDRVLDLMRALVAPAAHTFHIACDMSNLEDRDALPEAIARLQNIQEDANLGFGGLIQGLYDAQEILRRAGFTDIGECSSLVLVRSVGSGQVTPLTIESTRDAIRRIKMRAQRALDGPSPIQKGGLLRDVVRAVRDSMALPLEGVRGRLCVRLEGSSTRFDAELCYGRGITRSLCVLMTSPYAGMMAYAGVQRQNSLAFGAARMLDGLRELPISSLRVVNSVLDIFGLSQDTSYGGPSDLDELRSSLSWYAAVTELVIELPDGVPAESILEVVSSPNTLPALRCVRVEQTPAVLATRLYDMCTQIWWDALEHALRCRLSGGGQRVVLRIKGLGCIDEAWVTRMRCDVVEDVDLGEVVCRQGLTCTACSHLTG